MNKSKSNLLEFNYLRAIGIFLVVLGHSFPYIDETNLKFYKYLHSLIYSFHMPLFIMISGFFAYKILKINSLKKYKDFILSKFKKLIVPYLTISFIAVPIKLILNKFSERSLNLTNIMEDIFLYPWKNPIIFFWFIYVLFLIFLFSPLVVKLNKLNVLIIFSILSILPIENIEIFGISTILKYSIYFFVGIYLREFYINHRNKILNFKLNNTTFIFSILILSPIFFMNINLFTNSKNVFTITLLNFCQILKAFIGIYLCFILSLVFYKFNHNLKISKILKTISDYSFDIYLLSWFPQTLGRIVLYQILNLNYNLVVILSIILGFVPIIFSKFIFRKFSLSRKLLLGMF